MPRGLISYQQNYFMCRTVCRALCLVLMFAVQISLPEAHSEASAARPGRCAPARKHNRTSSPFLPHSMFAKPSSSATPMSALSHDHFNKRKSLFLAALRGGSLHDRRSAGDEHGGETSVLTGLFASQPARQGTCNIYTHTTRNTNAPARTTYSAAIH